jgi:hypothetical protein
MQQNSTDKIFYRLGLILLAGGLFFFFGQISDLINVTNLFPPCLFHTITGYYCPGCGCTRAVKCLYTGQIIQSFKYNPIVLYFVILYFIFMGSHTIEILIKKNKRIAQSNPLTKIHGIHFRPIYVYIGLAIILIQCIIKNINLAIH